MEERKRLNGPFVVWATYILWLTCLFDLIWSLLLFFCVGDLLALTGTDFVNALVLLSAVLICPQNIYLLYFIANNKPLSPNNKIWICKLSWYIKTVIVVNSLGAALCTQRLIRSDCLVNHALSYAMTNYRTDPGSKDVMDKLQVSLGCCGQNSYKDWFNYQWYDKMNEYAFEIPGIEREDSDESYNSKPKRSLYKHKDNVPLSCCKSGVCIANYINELGASLIHQGGCSPMLLRIVIISMSSHLVMFITVVVLEVLLLHYITKSEIDRNTGVEGIYHSNREFATSDDTDHLDYSDNASDAT